MARACAAALGAWQPRQAPAVGAGRLANLARRRCGLPLLGVRPPDARCGCRAHAGLACALMGGPPARPSGWGLGALQCAQLGGEVGSGPALGWNACAVPLSLAAPPVLLWPCAPADNLARRCGLRVPSRLECESTSGRGALDHQAHATLTWGYADPWTSVRIPSHGQPRPGRASTVLPSPRCAPRATRIGPPGRALYWGGDNPPPPEGADVPVALASV